MLRSERRSDVRRAPREESEKAASKLKDDLGRYPSSTTAIIVANALRAARHVRLDDGIVSRDGERNIWVCFEAIISNL